MNDLENIFRQSLSAMPIVAIIRGVAPTEAAAVSEAIADAGVTIIEVPLNTPSAMHCIESVARAVGHKCLVGCGTLTRVEDIPSLVDAGAKLAVTPSTQPEVIGACIEHELLPIPGFMTPTEAFAAIHAGARFLKLFPASSVGFGHLSALRAVMPDSIKVLAVGGIQAANMKQWLAAGAAGFGIGSDIFKPGFSIAEVAERTRRLVHQLQN